MSNNTNREKVNKFFNGISDVFGFIARNIKWFLLAAVLVMSVLLFRQCDNARKLKDEKARLENNLLAMNDTLENYRKDGYNVAEMRALRLKVEELTDSLKLERGKTPITIINYNTTISDTLYMPGIVVRDTVFEYPLYLDKGVVTAERCDDFGKSRRDVFVKVPYRVNKEKGTLESDECEVAINQDIWLESCLYKNKKGETFIRIKTDYPTATFNNGLGISVENGEDYDYKARKQFSLGIGVQAGYGVAFPDGRVTMSPYIGIGIGFQWSPRFLQF